jgi:hypothetical protein
MGNGTVVGPFFFRHNIDGDNYLQLINEEMTSFDEFGGHTVHLHTGEESSQIV